MLDGREMCRTRQPVSTLWLKVNKVVRYAICLALLPVRLNESEAAGRRGRMSEADDERHGWTGGDDDGNDSNVANR
jgi:hypothetical protein